MQSQPSISRDTIKVANAIKELSIKFELKNSMMLALQSLFDSKPHHKNCFRNENSSFSFGKQSINRWLLYSLNSTFYC
jgi:hypothetical protein